VIKKRNRGSGNSLPVGVASTRSSKKVSRKNSVQQQTPTTTPTSSKPHSASNSESPPSLPGSNGGSAGSTPTSFAGPPKSGVVPIAAAPPKPPPSSMAPSLNQVRAPVQVTPKRPRRFEKANSGSALNSHTSHSPDEEMRDIAGDTGKAPPPSARPKAMTVPPVMQSAAAANPANHSLATGSTHSGSQEWEWLTMSL
jgi:GATA-binding protein